MIDNARIDVHTQGRRVFKKTGVKREKIIIKNLKDRWGSMTKEGSLNLNVNLLKAPGRYCRLYNFT